MQNAESLSREQIQEFLRGSGPINFAGGGRDDRYGWVEQVLAVQKYGELGKNERGLVRAYMGKVTGLSKSQTTRLIRAFLDHGKVHHLQEPKSLGEQDELLRCRAGRPRGTGRGPPGRTYAESTIYLLPRPIAAQFRADG
jgi:hypothetical protein